MRDPNRLDSSYAQLCEIHKTYFPDMREGQFLLNLLYKETRSVLR